jgi:23S rRNA-intervening sequence protein
MSFKFEKLIVWQKSLDLAAMIDDTAKKFPKEEIYWDHKLNVPQILFC